MPIRLTLGYLLDEESSRSGVGLVLLPVLGHCFLCHHPGIPIAEIVTVKLEMSIHFPQFTVGNA